MGNDELLKIVTGIGATLQVRGEYLAIAESCTGGSLAALLTSVPGSSAWFDRGYVTYSNRAKIEMLGVPALLIAKHGAVSEEVVRAMAEGAMDRSGVHAAVAITGIAGPSGGSTNKPVGTVWIGWSRRGRSTRATRFVFAGNRDAVRYEAVHAAILGLHALINETGHGE
jgi:nicotinamide-nucleotide amidase